MTIPHRIAVTLCVSLLGAVGGSWTAAAAWMLYVGEGPIFPAAMAVGPLLAVKHHLPVRVWAFGAAPFYYAAASAALWTAARNRRTAMTAALLYTLSLTGPFLVVSSPFWPSSRLGGALWRELEGTYAAARNMPAWFSLTLVGLLAWHGFAWFRLAAYWRDPERPAAVRWLAAAVPSGISGAALAWCAMALLASPGCGQLPGLLVFGPFVRVDELPIPLSGHLIYATAAALLYGLTGFLIAAARDRRAACWPAATVWIGFGLSVVATFVWAETKVPDWLAGQWAGIGPGFRDAPTLFLPVFVGLVGWQVFVAWSLARAVFRPPGSNSGDLPGRHAVASSGTCPASTIKPG